MLYISDGDICFPFRVAYNERVGHYLVTTRDLSPLDVVLREKMGMPTGTLVETTYPTCLSCYSVLLSDKQRGISTDFLADNQKISTFSLCPHCNLPVCMPITNQEQETDRTNTPCYENSIHRDFECKLFQKRQIKLDISPETLNHSFYKVFFITAFSLL